MQTPGVGRLLRELLRPDAVPSPAQRALLPALGEELLEVAREHRVAGLLAVRLAAHGCSLPPPLEEELQQHRQHNELRHLMALRELGALADAIDSDWVVVKGPVLSSHWYGEAGARGYSDIDLLVHPKDFTATLEALREFGYRELADNWQGFERQEVAEVPLLRGSHTVDLHWHLVGSGRARRDLRLATGSMLARAVSVDIGDTTVATLDPIDTLLHLCVHSGLSGARRLLHLADVDVVVRSGDFAWEAVVRRARAERCAALVMAVLDRAVGVLGTPVPDGVREQLAPNPLLRSAVRALGRLRSDGVTGLGVPIEGVRDGTAPTMRITAERAVEAVRVSLGGTPPAEDPERISWQRPQQRPEDLVAARSSYLRMVAEGHEARPTREPSRLLRLFGDDQPRTSIPLAHAASARRLGLRTRAWVVRDRGGTPVAALVTVMQGPFQTVSYPLLRDGAAARTVARLVERSMSRLVIGFAEDVRPLEPHVARWRREIETKAGAIAHEDIPELEPTRSGLAQPSDCDELGRFVRSVYPWMIPSELMARPVARLLIERGCAVLRDGDRIVGYASVEASTPSYNVLGSVALDPDWRGQGLSWDLIKRLGHRARDQGQGLVAIVLAENPMSIPSENVQSDPGMVVWLDHPRRFRGEPRLWRLAQRLVAGRDH